MDDNWSRLKDSPEMIRKKTNDKPSLGSKRWVPREDVLEKNQRSTSAPKVKDLQTIGKSMKGTYLITSLVDKSVRNKTLPAAYGPVQPWLSTLAQKEDTRESFNELMDTPLDFSAFVMNRLKVDTLTPELLAGPTFKLMKGSCKSLVELEYFFEEVYKATTDQLDWTKNEVKYRLAMTSMHSGESHIGGEKQQSYGFAANRESACDVYSKCRIIAVTKLQIIEWHNYKHLDWITVRKLTNLTVEECLAFNVSLRMFTRSIVIQRRVEDLQLGVESYQKKLNLTKPDTYRSDLKRREAYTAYSNPRGFIYQNKDKKNKLMRIDELHKFSDGTLNDVRTALNDHLKGIRMRCIATVLSWRQSDRDKAGAMIQAIDKQLKTRRIMRSLEKFVGGRPYEGDFRLLQRTI
ncbi:hypothetical protein Tco_1110419 [Tanacetum coccineum]|uniref:Uncharacterized protein n=1 Tax=Tanacetum coccineum TaxID=301880 RepID=A0ABQ5IJY3_9ASTR